MRCAICRETTLLSDVAYVDTRPESDESDEVPVQVKGSHSTKVGAVVQQLLKIKAKEPDAKCLIFSTVNLFSFTHLFFSFFFYKTFAFFNNYKGFYGIR